MAHVCALSGPQHDRLQMGKAQNPPPEKGTNPDCSATVNDFLTRPMIQAHKAKTGA